MCSSDLGYIRVFADEGRALGRLLGQLMAAERTGRGTGAHGIAPGYLGRLARTLGDEAGPAARPAGPRKLAVPGLIEPLSSREAEILQLLAAGMQNQQIARARELGLLP